jgi:ribosome-associated protein
VLSSKRVRSILGRDTLEDDDLSLDTFAAGAATGLVPMSAHGLPAPDHSLLNAVLASLEDDKAEEVVHIDLRGKSEMGDYMVIATGRSTRQVTAMAEKLVDRVKQSHGVLSRVEGRETGDWVLIDAGDVIVHLFRPEVREFYQLEKLWVPGAPSPAGTVAPKPV